MGLVLDYFAPIIHVNDKKMAEVKKDLVEIH